MTLEGCKCTPHPSTCTHASPYLSGVIRPSSPALEEETHLETLLCLASSPSCWYINVLIPVSCAPGILGKTLPSSLSSPIQSRSLNRLRDADLKKRRCSGGVASLLWLLATKKVRKATAAAMKMPTSPPRASQYICHMMSKMPL